MVQRITSSVHHCLPIPNFVASEKIWATSLTFTALCHMLTIHPGPARGTGFATTALLLVITSVMEGMLLCEPELLLSHPANTRCLQDVHEDRNQFGMEKCSYSHQSVLLCRSVARGMNVRPIAREARKIF